jgi:hypothetical protein
MIAPRNASEIAFPISRWPNYTPPPNVSVAIFPGAISKKPYVMHPGIAPRPYMRPSIQETKPQIKKILGDSFKAAILINLREVWRST